MIWPNGPPKRLKNLGAHLDKQHEPFVHFAIAKTHFFGAFITQHHIGIYRIKPFVPTFIHTDIEANFSFVCVSPSGKYIAARSDNKIHVFRTTSMDSYTKVFEPKQQNVRDIGPGEALGIRQLELEPIQVIECTQTIVSICAFRNYLFVVSKNGIQFTPWTDPHLQIVDTGTLFDGFTVQNVSFSTTLSRLCFLSSTGTLLLVHLTPEALKTTEIHQPLDASTPLTTCFNSRMAKLAVIYKTQMALYNVKDLDTPPLVVAFPQPLGEINHLEWTLTGTALLIAHSEGWRLVSAFGKTLHASELPAQHCEWSVGGDELVLLCDKGNVLIYQVMRAYHSTPQLFGAAAILHSGNRLRVYVDRLKRAFPTDPWQTVPVPNSYLGMNWPITSAALSTNGRFVALSGAYGLVYMSTLEHQWKVFMDPDIMVRQHGIQWYNECLVLSVFTDSNQRRLEMYSTAANGAKVTDHEEQLVAGVDLGSNVLAFHASEKLGLLAVLLQDGNYQKYTITSDSFELVSEDNIFDLFAKNGNVSNLIMISEDRNLFLVDEKLIEVTKQNDGRFLSTTVHSPVEYFYLRNNEIWLFDGTEMVIVGVDDSRKCGIELDSYPTCIDSTKGLMCTTRSFEKNSGDGSYKYIEPQMELQVYLTRLFEVTDITASDLAKQYSRLEIFDDVMESILYHSLVSERSDLDEIVATIRAQCDWTAVLARCARKSETRYWEKLFSAFSAMPEVLFAKALGADKIEVAAEYLTILQAQFKADPGDANMVQLYKKAYDTNNIEMCQQLGEFLLAIDSKGELLNKFTEDLRRYIPQAGNPTA